MWRTLCPLHRLLAASEHLMQVHARMTITLRTALLLSSDIGERGRSIHPDELIHRPLAHPFTATTTTSLLWNVPCVPILFHTMHSNGSQN